MEATVVGVFFLYGVWVVLAIGTIYAMAVAMRHAGGGGDH